MKNLTVIVNNITEDLIFDLTCRAGLRKEWDQIDKEIRLEIRNRWKEIILNHIYSRRKKCNGRFK